MEMVVCGGAPRPDFGSGTEASGEFQCQIFAMGANPNKIRCSWKRPPSCESFRSHPQGRQFEQETLK